MLVDYSELLKGATKVPFAEANVGDVILDGNLIVLERNFDFQGNII